MWRLQEDSTTEIEENQNDEGERVPCFSTAEMCKKENWGHYNRNILLCDRTTHMEPEVDDDQDPDEIKKQIEAADPFEPRLKSIVHDGAAKGGYPAWTLRTFGDR